MAELSCAGTSMGDTTSAASTRPRAWVNGRCRVSVTGRSAAAMAARASSTGSSSPDVSGEGPSSAIVSGQAVGVGAIVRDDMPRAEPPRTGASLGVDFRAGRLMSPHSRSSRLRSRASTRTAACGPKPSMSAHRGWPAAVLGGAAPLRVSTFCPARGPNAIRQEEPERRWPRPAAAAASAPPRRRHSARPEPGGPAPACRPPSFAQATPCWPNQARQRRQPSSAASWRKLAR